jgi:hypothetical protein
MNTETVEKPVTQIAEYSPTAAGLAELRSRLVNVVYDVTTAVGMERARKDRRECVTLRTSLEKLRVQIKAPALERARLIDAEAKALSAELLALEDPIDAQIKKEEDRKEAEKQAKAKAEADRVATINKRIDWIRSNVAACINKPAALLAETIETLTALPVKAELYAEFQSLAQGAVETTLTTLREMHATAVANEIEAARLKAEREEFARQKAAQEAAAAAERARLAEEERAAKAKRDAEAAAERKRLGDEARIAREARAAEDASAKAERDAADKAAREQRAKEAAKLAEKQALERAANEAEQRRIADANAALAAREKAARDEEERQQAERDRIAHEAREREQAEARATQERQEAEARAEERRKAEAAQREAEIQAAKLRRQAIENARAEHPTPELAFAAIVAICYSPDVTDADARDAIALIAEAHTPAKAEA